MRPPPALVVAAAAAAGRGLGEAAFVAGLASAAVAAAALAMASMFFCRSAMRRAMERLGTSAVGSTSWLVMGDLVGFPAASIAWKCDSMATRS